MLLYYDIVRGYFLIDNSLAVCVSQFHAALIFTLPFMKFANLSQYLNKGSR